jgi:hypothetical protein
MRAHRIVLSLAMATSLGIAVQTPAFADEYRGTFAQQLACTPDVWRFCSEQIPDVNRITACLRQNTTQLSDGCRSVFESNDSLPQPSAPKGRNDQPRSYQ